MTENERLREALRDMLDLSVEDDSMWELHETSFEARHRAARNALAAKPEVCVWEEYDIDYGTWKGTCGVLFNLEVDGPKENGMHYCPRCGRKIEVKSYPSDLCELPNVMT